MKCDSKELEISERDRSRKIYLSEGQETETKQETTNLSGSPYAKYDSKELIVSERDRNRKTCRNDKRLKRRGHQLKAVVRMSEKYDSKELAIKNSRMES